MTSGPILIIPCSHCGFPGKKRTLLSCNNFGIELWSDGKKISPMYQVYPTLVKCKKCGSFFMAEENRAIDRIHQQEKGTNKWYMTSFFEFPAFIEYFEALGKIDNEKHLRLMIFQSFNDYIRNGKEEEIKEEMRVLYIDNLKSFLYLLSEDNKQDFLTVIEINRQLGRFDKCRELLDKNVDENFKELKNLYLNEVEKRNTRLFRLN